MKALFLPHKVANNPLCFYLAIHPAPQESLIANTPGGSRADKKRPFEENGVQNTIAEKIVEQ
jgi:hypothetical protein